MYYITLFVETSCLTCFITEINRKQTKLLSKQVVELQPIDDILILQTVVHELCRSCHQYKPIFRIIVADIDIRQGLLPLPNISLKEYEIETYVINSLVKLFHTQEPFSYDYQQQLKNETQQLVVTAYPQQKVKFWLTLCQSYHIDFIGVALEIGEYLKTEKNSLPLFEHLAHQPKITGFNFLPWREKIRVKKQILFFCTIAIYACICFILVFWLLYYRTTQKNQQIIKNQQVQREITLQSSHLLRIDELDKKLKQQQTVLDQQRSHQTQFMRIVNTLIFIANKIPDELWLSYLAYYNHRLKLTGYGFSYANILAFTQSLNDLETLKNHKLISVKYNKNLLNFELDILSNTSGINDEN